MHARAHRFDGRLVMVGFGCIGQGVMPLLQRHLPMRPAQITVVARSDRGATAAREMGVAFERAELDRDNFRAVLGPKLGPGDFLLNLSTNVASAALIELARERGALYLDTCIEPWEGGYVDRALGPAQRTNYALREAALALRSPRRDGPTALLTHGANPGLVSHFLERALLDIQRETGADGDPPASREGWARLAQRLGVRCIHVSERDTQVGQRRKRPDEFVNTWSSEAFIDEGTQPAELGWGTHERRLPADGARHDRGCRAAIWLARPGAATRVRSWVPGAGPIHGFLITHSESIAIADHLTVGAADAPQYRPTVHYAYHPCDDAVLSLHELAACEWRPQSTMRLLGDEITDGIDELGVLLGGPARGAYWYGSQLSIEQARALAPHNNATSLQVAAAVLAGVIWVIRNPARDIVEPDDLPHDEILAIARPYLGDLVGTWTDWTPLAGRGWLFEEDVHRDDPWQFGNVRVV